MGNKTAKQFNSFADWEPVQTQNGVQIYRNSKNNQLAQKRSITIDPQYDFDNQMQIYRMRQNNHDSLVRSFRAKQVQTKGKSEGICSGHRKFQVLTERMPYRLLELPQLTFPQSLLFLRQCLRGYNRVFKSYGPIQITNKLIAINELGQVKCWLNQNWALNHPSHELPTLQSTKLDGLGKGLVEGTEVSQIYDGKYRDQTEMVHNIVALIEQKCEQGQFPQAFSEQVYLHSTSFRKLSTYVEDFIRINELFIPPRINYQTVFVAKYQKKLTQQQHQQPLKGQNLNQSLWTGQPTIHNQQKSLSINQNATYLSGGFQQDSAYRKNNIGNQSVVQSHSQQLGISYANKNEGYSASKTNPTSTYGNIIGGNTVGYTIGYQTLKGFSPLNMVPSTSSANVNTFTAPWQNSLNLQKLPQTQGSYTSSFYQYSATNPSSIGVTSSSFEGIYSGTELNKIPTKPSSYTALSKSPFNAPSYNFSSNLNTMTSLQNRFGASSHDNPSSPYQNLDSLNLDQKYELKDQSTTTPSKMSYEEFKSNFTSTLTSTSKYPYSTAYQLPNKLEPNFSGSAQKGSTFSFDGKKQLTSKFGEYPQGQGQIKTYNTQQITNNALSGMKAQGEHSQAFDNSMGPLFSLSKNYGLKNSQHISPYKQNTENSLKKNLQQV